MRHSESSGRFAFDLPQVDIRKVKLDVLKPWITQRVAELLGMEDDVVVEFIFNQLEAKVSSCKHYFEHFSNYIDNHSFNTVGSRAQEDAGQCAKLIVFIGM